MPYTLDRRTRSETEQRSIDPATFFAVDFPALATRHGGIVADAIAALKAPPLSIEVESISWTIARDDSTVRAYQGAAPNALHLIMSAGQFSDWAQNLLSINGMMTARALTFSNGSVRDVSCWDAISHALLEGWPVAANGLTFADRHGAPLDFNRCFTPTDDPQDIIHFLAEAGYLHLRGWLDPADMAEISAEMDRALPHYHEGDGKSWWAGLGDGSRRCVRLQEFVEHSPTTSRILSSETWTQLRLLIAGDDRLRVAPVEGRIIEALFKPVGVVAGPSDVTFHRDCHLGRHAYSCARRTIGIALTPTSEENGCLRVIAGSHRVAMPVEIAKTAPYLPRISVPTEPGDLTVHLSCTLHEATPPVSAERRVMYTEMSLEDAVPYAETAEGRLRERVSDILRDAGPQGAAVGAG
ncbi:phytanoyl-CoA dioxygenase family protein [Sphingomonas sp. LaA6.9]|uniref:phytanoyl-CoA dioxygenase family protein n=1 Tax=Sphingomonas sp. LaA6.9 TaxID=2919914 RepID=UPI001F4FE4B7|nr:phytanoyl-CoA dioxygenase family protein [Sphingomonas sp. LaA6.9]MCJ8157852.1 phytanoyl-CoA dioxygenase family protein [Sphingomonas sp. LaA6.9]